MEPFPVHGGVVVVGGTAVVVVGGVVVRGTVVVVVVGGAVVVGGTVLVAGWAVVGSGEVVVVATAKGLLPEHDDASAVRQYQGDDLGTWKGGEALAPCDRAAYESADVGELGVSHVDHLIDGAHLGQLSAGQ